MALETKTNMSFLQFSGGKNICHTVNMKQHKVTKKPFLKEINFVWHEILSVCVVSYEANTFAERCSAFRTPEFTSAFLALTTEHLSFLQF